MTKERKEIRESLYKMLTNPQIPLGLQIALATEGSDISVISDKELEFLLRKYLAYQELDMHPHIDEDDSEEGDDYEF